MPHGEREVLRAVPLLVFCAATAGVFLLIALGTAIVGLANSRPADALVALVFAVVIVATFGRALRMRVELSEQGVDVHHVFRTDRVSWSEISTASVDYDGLHLHLRDGRRVTAGSMGKSNLSKWMGRRSAADDRLDAVLRSLEARR